MYSSGEFLSLQDPFILVLDDCSGPWLYRDEQSMILFRTLVSYVSSSGELLSFSRIPLLWFLIIVPVHGCTRDEHFLSWLMMMVVRAVWGIVFPFRYTPRAFTEGCNTLVGLLPSIGRRNSADGAGSDGG